MALEAAEKVNSAANKKAWDKAHNMQCVLNGQSTCKVPSLPSLRTPTLDKRAAQEKCSAESSEAPAASSTNDSSNLDLQGTTWAYMPGKPMQVSVGGDYMFGISRTDKYGQNKVYFRRAPHGWGNPKGASWMGRRGRPTVTSNGFRSVCSNLVQYCTNGYYTRNKIEQVSTDGNTVWALDAASNIYRGNGFIPGKRNTWGRSRRWKTVTLGKDGLTLKQISAAGNSLWGVSKDHILYYRTGISTTNPDGSAWARQDLGPLQIKLKQVSTDGNSVWGVNENDDIYFLEGISTSKPQGTKWVKVDGNMKQVSIGGNALWGVQKDGTVFFRTGISTSNPQGTEWKQIVNNPVRHRGTGALSPIGKMKQLEVSADGKSLWGVSESNNIWRRVYNPPCCKSDCKVVEWHESSCEQEKRNARKRRSQQREQRRARSKERREKRKRK